MFRDILASCHFVQRNPDEIIAHKLRDSMFAKPIYAAVTTISTTKHKGKKVGVWGEWGPEDFLLKVKGMVKAGALPVKESKKMKM